MIPIVIYLRMKVSCRISLEKYIRMQGQSSLQSSWAAVNNKKKNLYGFLLLLETISHIYEDYNENVDSGAAGPLW